MRVRAKAACGCCGRIVARATSVGGGKARVRHKCPHGQWCIFGERFGREGYNWPRCKECRDALAWARAVEAAKRGAA